MPNRYDTSNAPEGQYQPGFYDTVLLNRLGITDKGEMEDVQFDELVRFQLSLFEELTVDSQISAQDLCQWHRDWLGEI